MKRMLLTFVILSIFFVCSAPNTAVCYIQEVGLIKPFDPMLHSFIKVESNFNDTVINRLGYGGCLQIGQEMVDEVNRICKKEGNPSRYVLEDRLNRGKSIEMWYIVQNYWNPLYDLKRATKIWNPLASKRYYNKIKLYMTSVSS